jgi:hypothetical protein
MICSKQGARRARPRTACAIQTMKKQKTKKKLNKVAAEQQDLAAKFIAESKKEALELAPHAPLEIERQAEFHKD